MIEFKSSSHLTLGIEIELQLIDPVTLDLKPVANLLLEKMKHNKCVKPEIFQSMIEINTGICNNIHEAAYDLTETTTQLLLAADEIETLIASVGTHPFAKYSERKLFDVERYRNLIDRNQWIARRLMIFGLHMHLGMKDGDTAIRFNNFFLHLIPHLLGITASSPFWQGEDTGLASCRSTIFESCPTAGHPCRTHSWKEFAELCEMLIKSRSISSYKDLWWDIRPSPDFGTIEIRICDGLATISEALAVAAFIHALAHWYENHTEYNPEVLAPHMWMMRENKWRAARYGLEAEIISDADADLISLRSDIHGWIERLQPHVVDLGYGKYFHTLCEMSDYGTSHERQRRIFERTGSLREVVRNNVDEFRRDVLRHYPSSSSFIR